jgi:hypothetical protein
MEGIMHIYHSGVLADKGHKSNIPEECGANIVATPTPIPPPVNIPAIERVHIPKGAILFFLYDPDLFEDDSSEFLQQLQRMHDLGATPSQSVLLIQGEADGRELYFSPMRLWANNGGVPWYFPQNLDLYLELQKWSKVKTDESTIANLLATLPYINRKRAMILSQKYGADALKVLTLVNSRDFSDRMEYILELPGMDGLTVRNLEEICHFFGLEDGEHIDPHANLDIQFINLAEELGGKVINE